MKILGIIILIFGVIDLLGRFLAYDLWHMLFGINLVPILLLLGSFVEIALGAGILLYTSGNSR